MRVAAIDIGTNTALFVIADVEPDGSIRTVYEDHEIIRLGQHVDASGTIQSGAIERCVAVIHRFREKAELFQCEKIIAAGTSAIRDAANRSSLINEIQSQTGVIIKVLSGDDEALCTFLGGRLTLNPDQRMNKAMVIDVGGGSTEIVTGDHRDIDFKISMNIGAVRMTERFLKHDPVDQDEETRMRIHCREVMERSLQKVHVTDYTHIIGVAGTITTLAAMIQRMPVYQPEKIDGFKITTADIQDQIYRLKVLTIDKRKLLDGLEPKRADVIFAGAVIMEEILQFFCLSQITTSNYGLRYGMILKALNS